MKKLTTYVWAFLVSLVLFFAVGVCTLGSVKTSGESMTVVAGTPVYYDLGGSVKVNAVYVNIGAIHGEIGSDATITMKKTTSLTSAADATWANLSSPKAVGNITSTDNIEGAQYNWIAIATGVNSNASKLAFHTSVNLELCEIVVLGTSGNIIEVKPYTYGSTYGEAEVAATLDAQENFEKLIEDGVVNLKTGAFDNFTQEEGYYMSVVQNFLSGNEFYKDSKRLLDRNFNYFATLLMAPSVAIFGTSVFALRLPAFLATCLLVVFAFLLMKELTKKDKYAFFFSLLFMLGGLATTVGRFGAPYALVACALFGSLYFMYRFFARGISSKDVFKGGMNVLVSGLFGAAALAMDTAAIFPVLGIFVLFAFGMKRQKTAHELALQKLSDAKESDVARETYMYGLKNRAAYGMAGLGFGVGTLFILLLAGVFAYFPYVRAGKENNGFLIVLWNGIADGFRSNAVTSVTVKSKVSILSWLLPFSGATLYEGAKASGEYLTWSVFPNTILCFAALAAFIACTVKAVMDIVKKKNDREDLRVRRTYFVLLGGMVAAMVAGLARGNVSALGGMLFQLFYFGFLPLAWMAFTKPDCKKCNTVATIIGITLVVAAAVVFAISVPAMYGFTVSASFSKWFTLFL